eukprot:341005-Rhodomonas_salina.1
MDAFTSRLMDLEEQLGGAHNKRALPARIRLKERIKGEERESLLEAFRVADRAKDGTLVVEEFMEILAKHLYGFSDADIMELVDMCRTGDRDFSGVVHYEEFQSAVFGSEGSGPASKSDTGLPLADSRRQSQDAVVSSMKLPPLRGGTGGAGGGGGAGGFGEEGGGFGGGRGGEMEGMWMEGALDEEGGREEKVELPMGGAEG